MKTKQSEAVHLIIKQRYWYKFSCRKTVDLGVKACVAALHNSGVVNFEHSGLNKMKSKSAYPKLLRHGFKITAFDRYLG
jgi:hypothetical protein